MLEADAGSLSQLFLNLFLNAIQAMPDEGRIFLSSRFAPDGRILIEVADTGTGIDQAALGKVFDPFYTTKASGTGMGLAVAYRIISEHQGTIEVESKLGEGTTFKIILKNNLP